MPEWSRTEGIDGNLYDCRYFLAYEHSDLADNDGNFRKHKLLAFLGYLSVIQYVRDYDSTYEIIMRVRK